MLSKRDRRALQDIEQQISNEDPGFAAVMRHPPSDRAYRWTRRSYDAVIILAALLAVVCLALFRVGAGGAGAVAALLAAVTFYLRRRRFPAQPDRGRSGRRPPHGMYPPRA